MTYYFRSDSEVCIR